MQLSGSDTSACAVEWQRHECMCSGVAAPRVHVQWSFKHPKPVTQTVPRHLRRSVTTAAAAPGAGGWQLWGPVWVGFDLGNFGVRFGLDLDWVLLGRVIDGWDEGSSDFRDPDLPLHLKSRVTSTFKGIQAGSATSVAEASR